MVFVWGGLIVVRWQAKGVVRASWFGDGGTLGCCWYFGIRLGEGWGRLKKSALGCTEKEADFTFLCLHFPLGITKRT